MVISATFALGYALFWERRLTVYNNVELFDIISNVYLFLLSDTKKL